MKKNEYEKRKIRVYPSHSFDMDTLTGSLDEVIKKLQGFPITYKNYIKSVKEGYKGKSNLVLARMCEEWEKVTEFKIDTIYDSESKDLEMQYFREETDEEVKQRIKKYEKDLEEAKKIENQTRQKIKERELKLLAELKKKYEPTTGTKRRTRKTQL